MSVGAITDYIDVAQLVLYAFWIFFALLIIYIRREDKREGYPLESDRRGGVAVVGFPSPPAPKTFHLYHGGTSTVPREVDERPLAAEPAAKFPGAPFEPTGNPMQDGVGAAGYAMREEVTDLTSEGDIRIVPLRAADGFGIAPEDPDPRGMSVIDSKRNKSGTVVDLWLDHSDMLFRYLEVKPEDGSQNVLVPMMLAQVSDYHNAVKVVSVTADQVAAAPRPKSPDLVTLREEDQIAAYFAGGHLYANWKPQEPPQPQASPESNA
jgi:photosynthetic reaction center H subunit